MSHRQLASGVYLNESGDKQYQIPGGAFVNNTQVSGPPSASLNWAESDDLTQIDVNIALSFVTATLAWTEDNDVFALNAVLVSPGTLTTTVFKNNTGSVLTNLAGLTCTILLASDLSFVKTLTGETTDGSGVLVLNDALFVSGTEYAIVVTNAAGTLGAEKYTAT